MPTFARNALRAQGWVCCHCGKRLTAKQATAEHIVPVSLGGLDRQENIAAACYPCNNRRGKAFGREWFQHLPPSASTAAMEGWLDVRKYFAEIANDHERVAALDAFFLPNAVQLTQPAR